MKKILIAVAVLLLTVNQDATAWEKEKPPIKVRLSECDSYQIIIYATRKGSSLTSTVLGYCSLEEAQNKLAQLNAMTDIELPKGQPIKQVAFPLFD